MNSAELLYDIHELGHLFRESVSIETLLNKAVEMVAARTKSAVCSIYLYNPGEQMLTLQATRGLSRESIGNVRMKIGEGLTGLALQQMQPVCEKDASRNPHYRFFPGIHEELYEAFLALPIARGVSKIGVLVLQRNTGETFAEGDITALQTVASQLGNIIENAQFLLRMHLQHEEPKPVAPAELRFVKGKSAAPGFAYAPAMVIDVQQSLTHLLRREFSTTYALADFQNAVTRTAAQLEGLQERVERQLSDAASLIFSAHLMILKDQAFLGEITRRIQTGVNPPLAVAQAAEEFTKGFLASESNYMREKVNDIEDLAIRLVNNIISETEEVEIYRQHVVITRDLYPSDLLKLSSEDASAVVLVGGGVTGHVSILARSLSMPMITTDRFELLDVTDGTPILIDAEIGNLYVDPSDEILQKFQAQQDLRLSLDKQKELMKPQTLTGDGIRVDLLANINLLTDLKAAAELKADGIGLYRTEFPFIVRTTFPSEAEQYVIYRKIVESMPGKPITLRTLDAGGDKILSYYHDIEEQNPAMGMRSIRFSLENKAIFMEQIRAMLRAGVGADLGIMFPMISSVDEFGEAKAVVIKALEDLAREGLPHNDSPRLGMMVELPSIGDLIDDFAREADFFSIGTNDLVQFMLAVDRTNDSVAHLYLPHHPAVLRFLNTVVGGAIRNDCKITICGDMGHQLEYLPFLLGIGIRSLSMDPGYLLKAQQAIEGISIPKAEALARDMLAQSRISDIEAILEKGM
jgi:phosphotransferase system, enzyme I, PtsP